MHQCGIHLRHKNKSCVLKERLVSAEYGTLKEEQLYDGIMEAINKVVENKGDFIKGRSLTIQFHSETGQRIKGYSRMNQLMIY